MTMITPSYLGETIEYSSLHACRSTLEDPMRDVGKRVGNSFTRAGEDIILIGETRGHLGCSLYLREILGREDGPPPPVDLVAEKKNGDFVRGLIANGMITACHDVSDGGLLVALAEMTYRGVGAFLDPGSRNLDSGFWFGEDQARYVIAVDAAKTKNILSQAAKAGITAAHLGKTQADTLEIKGQFSLPVTELIEANESWLPKYMGTK